MGGAFGRFGREPLANLDEVPVEVSRLLLVADVQGAEPRPGAAGGRGAAPGGWLSGMGRQIGRLGCCQPILGHNSVHNTGISACAHR